MKYKELEEYLTSDQPEKAKQEFLKSCDNKVTEAKFLKNNILKEATENNNISAIKFLINSCGVNPNWKVDIYGNSILFFVNELVTTQILLQCGANINQQGVLNRLPLHNAPNLSIAKLFLTNNNLNAPDIYGNTPLHTAASDGKADIVQFLLGQGRIKLNLTNRNKQTALHLASTEKEAKLLADHGIDVNIEDVKGRTALHLSSNEGLTSFLLSRGANIEATDFLGQTPLHYALESYSKKGVAKVLINSNADIYSKDVSGKTPLHKLKSLELGNLLFKLFPEFKGAVDSKDSAGKTPLQYAITEGRKSLAILFVHSGANVNQAGDNGKSLLHLAYNKESVDLLISKGIGIDTRDASGKTPLYDALFNGYDVVARTLLSCEAKATQEEKDSLLFNAALKGYKEVAKLLCENGAALEQLDSEENKNLTYITLRNNHIDVAEFFLSKNILITQQEKDLLLKDAVSNGYIELVSFLIESGANINQLDSHNNGLLYIAIKKQNAVLTELLFKKGLKLSTPEEESLVQEAVNHSNKNLIELLIDAIAFDINKPDSNGKILLHYVVQKGDQNQVNYYLTKGAKTDLLHKEGLLCSTIEAKHNYVAKWLIGKGAPIEKALFVAVSSGNLPILQELIKAGANLLQIDADGNNLLSYALQAEIVNLLMTKSPELKSQIVNNGKATLLQSTKNNNKEVSQALLEQGVIITQEEKDTMLGEAIASDHQAIVEVLINYGAHVNQQENNPLHNAARYANLEAAKLLLSKGADIKKLDKSGKMAIDYVSEPQIAEFLAYRMIYADINQNSQSNSTFAKALAKLPNINAQDDDGKTLLIHAVTIGNKEIITQLLSKGNLHITDNTNKNAIYYAVSYLRKDITQLLLGRGAKIDELHKVELLRRTAAEYVDNPEMAEVLYQYGININEAYMLHSAGGVKIVNWALSKGVDINQVDGGGQNALSYAVRNHKEVAKLLLNRGIRVEEADKIRLLEEAADQYYGDKDLMQLLMHRGADIRKACVLHSRNTVEMAKWMIAQGADIHALSNDSSYRGKNALYSALFNGDMDLAEFFINQGLKIEESDKTYLLNRGFSSYNYQKAFTIFTNLGIDLKESGLLHKFYNYPEIVEWLIQRGANVNELDKYGHTALLNAAYSNGQVFKLLLKHGAKMRSEEKIKALTNAVNGNNKEIIELLLASGADIKQAPVLHHASNIEMALWLIGKGADIKIIDEYGHNALYRKANHASANSEEIIKLFLNHGLTLTTSDRDQLLENSMYGHVDAVKILVKYFGVDVTKVGLLHKVREVGTAKYLIEQGADVNAIDEHGKNPLCNMIKNGYLQVALLLFKHGARFADEDKILLFEKAVTNAYTDIIDLLAKDGVDLSKTMALHWAPNLTITRWLVTQGADINFKNDKAGGQTAVASAASANRLDVVKFLLEKGVKFVPNEADALLVNAVAVNNKALAEILVKFTNNIKQLCVLHAAPNVHMAEWLIGQGADIQLKDNAGKTALYRAADVNYGANINSKTELVKFFMQKGLLFAPEDKTPLMQILVCYGGKEIGQLVINSGFDINQAWLWSQVRVLDMAQLLISQGANIHLLDSAGKNALYHSIFNCATEVAKLLITKGIKLEDADKIPLLERVASNKQLVEILISQEANLKQACILHNVSDIVTAKWLIEKGANPQLKDARGKNALYKHSESDRPLMVKLLLETGLEFEAADIPELLSKAVTHNYKEVAKILVENGGDVRQLGLLGKATKVDMAKWLILRGAKVNDIDENGNTALHFAVKTGNQQLVKFLVEEMDIDNLLVKNSESKTALHYANEGSNQGIVSEILSGLNLGLGYHDNENLDHDVACMLLGESLA